MNRILDIGYPLRLGINDEPFIIRDILGKGASSVTYLAECNQTEHVLKECNPLGLHMHREDNGGLVPDTELNKTKFDEYLSRFVEGANKQLAFRLTDDLKNTTSNVQAIYHANNTVYIDMTFFNGKTYDQVEYESLYDLLRRMKALAQVVSHYHDMGYLHLDIKPQNIYAIPETPEMVMMFDFDSVVPEADVENTVLLSYTDSWAAPEQKMAKYRKSICKATDLFAIGEIIFHRVMGRHSCADERFDFSKYAYDRNAKIFENVNPKAFRLLDDLFHKTLCCAPTNRIQTSDELIVLLDEIIPLATPKEHFLVGTLPTPKEFFIGRDEEIEDIHARLQQSPVLFLHGIGGIGKSELAKQYAKKYFDAYDAIVFTPFVTDVVSMITDDNYVRINHFNRTPDQSIEDYYELKIGMIKDLISNNKSRILFLIDNLDTTEDPNFKVLLELGCRVLITSRIDFSDDFAQLDLDAISNPFAIFREYYINPLSDAETDIVYDIISIVSGHTMMVELLAKQMMASRIAPEQMLKKLKSTGISESGKEKIHSVKDGNQTTQSTFEHIQALFDLSDLDENEGYILANLALIPNTGISTKMFCEWCDIDNFDTINRLEMQGWLLQNKENDHLYLHALVSEVTIQRLHSLFNNNLPVFSKSIDYFSNCSITATTKYELAALLKHISLKIINAEIKNHFTIKFILEAVIIFSRYGATKESIECCQNGLTFIKELSLVDSALIARYNNWLGLLYSKQGDTNKSELHCKEALNIRLQTNDADDIAESYNNLGTVCHEKGQLNEAITYYKKALEYWEKDYSSNVNNIAALYNNFAKIFTSKVMLTQAETYYKKAIELYNKEDAKKATIYGNLGDLYDNQGRFKEAEEYYLKALDLRTTLFADYSPVVAVSYNSLAKIYRKTNQVQKAEYCYKKALELRLKFDDVNMMTAESYGNLGVFYCGQNDFQTAREYILKAISICETLNMFQSKSYAIYCFNLGNTYHSSEDYALAEAYYLKALEIYMNFYNEETQDINVFYNTLETLYMDQGKTSEAQKYRKKANMHKEENQRIKVTHKYKLNYAFLSILFGIISLFTQWLRIVFVPLGLHFGNKGLVTSKRKMAIGGIVINLLHIVNSVLETIYLLCELIF